jgi:hypothetical protein
MPTPNYKFKRMMIFQRRHVLFKEVWTNNTTRININPNWTITQFIENVRPILAVEFNTHDFDIIEAGQNVHNIVSETAPALEYSNIQIKNKWGDSMNVSFYIRKNNTINHVEKDIENPLLFDECPICYENVILLKRDDCNHRICNNCIKKCDVINYNICPVCRNG